MPSNPRVLEHELLAIRCQLGESAAFDELVDRWHAPLGRYLRRMVGDHDLSADLLQETWLRVLRGIVKLREPQSLVAWIFGIARRVLMDRLRQRLEQDPPGEDTFDVEALAIDERDRCDDLEQLEHALAKLPLPQRELLTLYYSEELSVDEVARVLGIPAGTVKSRLHHVRRLLKGTLSDAETSS